VDVIAVMGASGNTGMRISEQLLQEGEKLRVLGRSAGKLAGFESRGAEVLAGYAADAAYLTSAFHGAEAVYTLLPPDPQSHDLRNKWDQEGAAIVRAIRDSGVRFVVFLSSVGADLLDGTGPIAGLYTQEERLRLLPDVNVLILRPASFFENFYAILGLVKHQGINGGAVAPDLRLPMIATRDIADVAACALKARDWTGVVVRELLGARDLTFAEATRIIGVRIGKPDLQYVQFSYADFAASLVQMGISENVAGLYAEMARGYNEGRITSREDRGPENTTPTRFEDFAEVLARAYEAT
jgi:uncharacterized protein YbjT (DUF2867 family)